jgi:hypothetical protein
VDALGDVPDERRADPDSQVDSVRKQPDHDHGGLVMDPELVALLALLPPPSERERQEQALCFAYGQLACTEDHRPHRSAFAKLARDRYGWTAEEFSSWAEGRTWA